MAIKYIEKNEALEGLARMKPDVVFSTETGVELKLQLLVPWNEERSYPLIVFVQGSGFTFPDVYYELPQLALYAQRGYVVATVTHRNMLEGHPAPAYLQDVKTAIRFLRHNANEYHIDKNRVCAFGTSSGGNTVLMLGLTGDNDKLKTNEYADESDAVQLVVECFGPVDLAWLSDPEYGHDGFLENLIPKDCEDVAALARSISPIYVVNENTPCPPTLIIQGDADEIVEYVHGHDMYEKLLACGKDAEMICVKGAPHEGSFWSKELHDMILDYISRKL